MTLEELEQRVDDGDSATDRLALADMYGRIGRLRDAVHHYRSAIALGLDAEEEVRAFYGCAGCYRALGNYFRAAKLLEDGVARHPDVPALTVLLALTHARTGMHLQAVKDLTHCLVEFSDHDSIRSLGPTLLHLADTLEESTSESEYRHVHHD